VEKTSVSGRPLNPRNPNGREDDSKRSLIPSQLLSSWWKRRLELAFLHDKARGWTGAEAELAGNS
jgi:hypothetical protein